MAGQVPQIAPMENQEETLIYSAAINCDAGFTSVISLVEHQSNVLGQSNLLSSHFLQDSHGQFNAWASYTGAFAEQKYSLDRRLKFGVEVRDMVLRLLKVLKRSLDHRKNSRLVQFNDSCHSGP